MKQYSNRIMRSKIETERDRAFIAERYCQGATLVRIAVELRDRFYPDKEPFNVSNISRDIQIVVGRWQRAAIFTIDQYKAIEIQKINTLEQEYYDAWMRSKESRERTVTERLERGGDEDNLARIRARIASEERDGNPNFLAGVQWCIDRRCKLLGLDTPAKIDNSGEVKLHVVYENRRASISEDSN